MNSANHHRATTRAVNVLALGCALLVLLGSRDFRTTRVFPDRSTASDGAGDWAVYTFGLGVVAAGLLLCVLLSGNGVVPLVSRPAGRCRAAAVGSAVVLGLAAIVAGANWSGVLGERTATNYVIRIAGGLPVVTVAAATGAVLASTLVVLLPTHHIDAPRLLPTVAAGNRVMSLRTAPFSDGGTRIPERNSILPPSISHQTTLPATPAMVHPRPVKSNFAIRSKPTAASTARTRRSRAS